MAYARIGVYRLTGGDAAAKHVLSSAEEGLLPLFRRHTGFIDYRVVHAEGTIISVSTWHTLGHANASTLEAASWVLENLGEYAQLTANYIGPVAVSSRE